MLNNSNPPPHWTWVWIFTAKTVPKDHGKGDIVVHDLLGDIVFFPEAVGSWECPTKSQYPDMREDQRTCDRVRVPGLRKATQRKPLSCCHAGVASSPVQSRAFGWIGERHIHTKLKLT